MAHLLLIARSGVAGPRSTSEGSAEMAEVIASDAQGGAVVKALSPPEQSSRSPGESGG
jgi:hypothetical protein